jgi:uncharacterized SAM-binding protein YcdF (DUF218 family)
MQTNEFILNNPALSKPAKLYRSNDFVAQLLRIFAILGALALFTISAGLAFMLGVGHWLVKEDSLQKADAIAVLSGNFPARALEAAVLYRNGYAGEIWLTRPGAQSQELAELGIHYPSEADFNYQVLRRQGVPAKAIHVLDSPIINTQDELEVISAALRQKNVAAVAVIVVTNKAHTRRVHELWNKLDSSSGKIIVHAISKDNFQPSAWWTRTGDTHQVIHEVFGMINLWAGLPMQSALHSREAVAQNELRSPTDLVPVLAQESASDSDD